MYYPYRYTDLNASISHPFRLTVKATLGELTSLEELTTQMAKQGLISTHVIQSMWDIFGKFFLLSLSIDVF